MGAPPQDPEVAGSSLRPSGPSDAEPGFEACLERLEHLVAQLEDGSLDLEAALAAFEEGVRLTRHCAERLAAVERRLEVLTGSESEPRARPLDVPDGAARAGGTGEDDAFAPGRESGRA